MFSDVGKRLMVVGAELKKNNYATSTEETPVAEKEGCKKKRWGKKASRE